MTYEVLAGIISFAIMLITIMTPIIKLNSSITKLNVTIDNLIANFNETKYALTKHEDRIKAIEIKMARMGCDKK